MGLAAYFNSAGMIALPRVTIASVFDILAVAFLIYQALMIVRGTRAGHILIGILIMVAVYVVALYTGLVVLRSVLALIVPYLALAVIVLFQSEIRRTLARLGRKHWFGRGYQRPEFTEDILIAMRRMSADRVGALIVVERDIGLRTFVESGVRLDAQISTDLLLSIFHPGGALHDGAVIVQKDRVAAAACFLPLALNPSVATSFGTRHRAAIGITEETDCLSLVVSEETGRISVAAGGTLTSGLSLREVDDLIAAHFGVAPAAPRLIEDFAADIPMEDHSGKSAPK